MTKEEYVKQLERHIAHLPQKDHMEILADYEEHFQMGRAAGKKDDEICNSLGTPRSVANAILMNNLVVKAESSDTFGKKLNSLLKILLLMLVMAPFNFLMLIGPFLVMFVLLIVGWVVPVIVVAGGIVAIWAVGYFGGITVGVLAGLSAAFALLGTIGAAILIGMIMALATAGTLRMLVSYFKWNVNFIFSQNA